MLKFLLFF